MKKYYIYKMIHLPTGRIYIGQRKLPKNKSAENDNYYGSGVIWKQIYKAHPNECVKIIIDYADTKKDIDELEIKYISHYKAVWQDKCVNLAIGGAGGKGMAGKHHTAKTKLKIAQANKGHKISEEQKEKISRTIKKRYELFPEEREKCRKNTTRYLASRTAEQIEEYKIKMSKSLKAAMSKLSKEQLCERAKKSAAKISKEQRRKNSLKGWEKRRKNMANK